MRKFGKSFLVYALSGMLILPPAYTANAVPAVDGSIYKGGNIYTMTDTMAEAKDASRKANQVEIVITENGKIVYAGSASDAPEELMSGKKEVNLNGKTMLPGFIDGHGHYTGFATVDLYGVNLYPTPIGSCDTMATMVERLKVFAEKTPPTYTDSDGEQQISVIKGSGYDDTLLDKAPSADQLDAASTEHYIIAGHISGHLSTVNTKLADAILNKGGEMVGKELGGKVVKSVAYPDSPTNDAPVYTVTFEDDSTKEFSGVIFKENAEGKMVMTGVLNELDAMGLANVFPTEKQTDEQIQNIQKYASDTYASAGVTTANQSFLSPDILPKYRQYIKDGDLRIRVSAHPPAFGGFDNYMRGLLGWTKSDPSGHVYDTVGPKRVGDDLTYWDHTTKKDLAADGIPPHRVILATHKTLIDGSNQGYTGYFKKDGYYDVTPDPTHTYAPYDPARDLYDPAPEDKTPQAVGFENQMWGTAATLNLTRQTLQDTIDLYHSQGEPLTVHANGSWANELLVGAIERAVMKNPEVENVRHTIIHAQMQELLATQRLAGNYDAALEALAGTEFENHAAIPAGGTGYVKGTKDLVVNGVIYYDVEGYASPDKIAEIPDFPGGNAEGEYYSSDGQTPVTTTDIEELAALMKKQNIVSSYYVDHTYYWGHRHKTIFMGPGRGNHISPMGWAVANDHYYTVHDDTPIVPMLPLRLLESSTTRIPFGQDYALSGTSKDINATVQEYVSETDALAGDVSKKKTFWNYDQRVTVLQALLAQTQYGAFSINAEDIIGTIEEGKYADFVILDQDPFKTEKTALADIRVAATIVSDELVYGFLPTAIEFATLPTNSLVQAPGVTTFNEVATPVAAADREKYATLLEDGETSLAMSHFTAEVAGGAAATFQMTILGHGDKVSTLKLKKFVDNGTLEYTRVNELDFTGNNFWISEQQFPNAALSDDTVLELDQYYVLRFVIQDDGVFDVDDDIPNKVTDPLGFATTSSSIPTNGTVATPADSDSGSSGGGCTVGSDARYDLLFLLIAAGGLMLIRARRREDA